VGVAVVKYLQSIRWKFIERFGVRKGKVEKFHGGFKIIKSEGRKRPINQLPHVDFGAVRQHDRSDHSTGMVSSILVSLQGMELDIWETVEALEKKSLPFPQHPSAVPSVTVSLDPSDMIMFRTWCTQAVVTSQTTLGCLG